MYYWSFEKYKQVKLSDGKEQHFSDITDTSFL